MSERVIISGRRFIADDRDYVLSHCKSSTRSRRFWFSRWFGDQGLNPSCVGYAWSHWLECSPICQFMNPEGIYTTAKFYDEWQGEDYKGTSVRAGAKVLHKLGFIPNYVWIKEIGQLMNFILNYGPVVMGTDWYEGMCEPTRKGIIRVSGESIGGHAYILDGYKPGWFRLKNSWNRTWGNKGRAWIHQDDIYTLMQRDGEACAATEVKPIALTK